MAAMLFGNKRENHSEYQVPALLAADRVSPPYISLLPPGMVDVLVAKS